MLQDGTYQLINAVGTCRVGTVWSAVDAQGTPVTVAVLDAAVAADQRWRDAFAAAANAIQDEAGGTGYLHADFSAPEPWVACAAGDGPGAEQVFRALGMDYLAMPPDEPSTPTAGALRPATPQPAPPQPDGAAPGSPAPSPREHPPTGLLPVAGSPVPTPPAPIPSGSGSPPPESSVSPAQVPDMPPPASEVPSPPLTVPPPPSETPQSPVAGPLPPAIDSPWPTSSPHDPALPYDRTTAYQAEYEPAKPARPRRTGLWVGTAIAVAVVLAAAGGVYAWQAGGGAPAASSSASPSSVASLPQALPTASPAQPGLEPPKAGAWPAQWPRFAPADRVRTFALEGVGFPVKTPLEWQCSAAGRAEGLIRYNCGAPGEAGVAIGGELVVRSCPQPCGSKEQTAMRQAEEAWGLQWVQVGPSAYFAESSSLQVDGKQQYGLVIVAFWRSGPDGALDRELVYRATSPVDGAGQLRRVANYIREAALF
jgi:hypothetical protein